jgi:hypothetical protein
MASFPGLVMPASLHRIFVAATALHAVVFPQHVAHLRTGNPYISTPNAGLAKGFLGFLFQFSGFFSKFNIALSKGFRI